MAKKYKRVLTLALVPFVAVNIYAGAKIANKNKSVDTKDLKPSTSITEMTDVVVSNGITSIPETVTVIQEDVELSESSAPMKEEEVTIHVVDEDPFKHLERIYNDSGLNYEDILGAYGRNDDLYASALYFKLINSGLSFEEIKEQMSNVVTMGSVFIDIDELTWERLFGKIEATISKYENPVDYYYPLAKYIHLHECMDEHEQCYEDSDRIYCDSIGNKLAEMNDTVLLESYILSELYYDTESIKVKNLINKIYDHNLTLCDVFQELDFIYTLSMIPMDFDEETWNMMFKNLLTTVGEYDNVCEVYYDLAYYVHSLCCDNDHTLNEFGTYECEPYKLRLDPEI